MNPTKHIFSFIGDAMQLNWDYPCFSDYGENTNYTYGQVAAQVEKLNLAYQAMGIEKGEKIAFCGVNSAHWGISFISVLAYQAVAVSILPDFTGPDIEKLVNHSGAKILLAGPMVAKKIDPKNLTNIKAVINYMDFSVVYAQDEKVANILNSMDDLFAQAHPNGFTFSDVHYPMADLDELALINYTSGTTSSPKGVMLTYRSLSTNTHFAIDNIPHNPHDVIVSMLPLAHMFGMAFEFLYQFAAGDHIYFLPKMSTPILLQSFKECKPYLIFMVPLVIEKIYQKKLRPIVKNWAVKMIWNWPIIGTMIRNKVREGLMEAFGGNVFELIIGGAALSNEVEKCLMDIQFPFTVGYGMTECGPLISYRVWNEFKAHSCGRIVDRMEIRIDSEDPHHVVGELQVRGEAVMQGYYKNEEATKGVFTADGWLRTGDLGIIDEDGNIFIKGRSKNMILGPSGQNIYPEEIEEVVNARGGIAESVVVSRNGKLVALVYPDFEYDRHGRTDEEQLAVWKQRCNKYLPAYSQISAIEVVDKEFEKTPKKSIKRFLYS